MRAQRTFFTLAILGILLSLANAQVSSFTTTFDTVRRYNPQYTLGYLLAGNTLNVNITVPGLGGANAIPASALNFVVETNTFPATTVTCTSSCTSTSSCTYNCPILISQAYRMNVTVSSLPADTQGFNPRVLQFYQLQAGTYLTSAGGPSAGVTSILKTSDAFRDRVTRLIYVDSGQSMKFSLYPVQHNSPTPNLNRMNLHLYKVSSVTGTNNVYDITGSAQILTNPAVSTQVYDNVSLVLDYTIRNLQRGFYVLVVSYLQTNVNFIRMSFQTSKYTCPFSKDYPDTNLNFQGCSVEAVVDTTKKNTDPYCTLVIQSTQLCDQCIFGYAPTAGVCAPTNPCSDRQYYRFGSCFDVSPLCGTFNRITGDCTSCSTPTYIVSAGTCIPDQTIVTCTSRQYKVNNRCFDVSSLCGQFNPANGNCVTCSLPDYEVQGGNCVQKPTIIEPPKITCLGNQYLSPRTKLCTDIPPNCPSFNSEKEACDVCTWGYSPNTSGGCSLIICSFGQVLASDGRRCIPMPPNCATYDSRKGECTACTDRLYTLIGGRCTEPTGGSALSGCAAREALGFGSCEDAKINCANYNLRTGDCDDCLPQWVKDYTGSCKLPKNNNRCRDDETSIQGICVQKPEGCNKVNNIGLCTECASQYKLSYGICSFQKTCPANQYLGSDDNCRDIIANCAFSDPAVGCITCANDQPPVDDLCCPKGQVVQNRQCIEVFIPQDNAGGNNDFANNQFFGGGFGGGFFGGFGGSTTTGNNGGDNNSDEGFTIVDPAACLFRSADGTCKVCNQNYTVSQDFMGCVPDS